MKRKLSSSSNGLHKNGFVTKIVAEQKKRVLQDTAAAYAKAKANKLPGKLDWDGFIHKHRAVIEQFLRARHGGGLEPLPTQET